MRVINLHDYYGFSNGIAEANLEKAKAVLKDLQDVYDYVQAGTAYIRFLDGDRKGSIARLTPNPAYRNERPVIEPYYGYWRKEYTHRFEHARIFCIARWTGRSNKVQISIPDFYQPNEILLDYAGPTVWEKFDAAAAKAEILKKPDQRDINDRVLQVGDRVLYINARYGSRMTLEEGIVKEFLASANSKGHSVTTVIESNGGERSELSYPESMVYKI